MAGVDMEDVRRDYEAGMSLRALALKYNCSKSVVNKWAKQKGWQRGQVDRAATEKSSVSTGEAEPDYARVRSLAVKLLDRVEDALDNPKPMDSKALRAIGATLLDVRQLLNAVSPVEAEEQRLRLTKLQRETEAGSESSEINVRIIGMNEEEISEVIG